MVYFSAEELCMIEMLTYCSGKILEEAGFDK